MKLLEVFEEFSIDSIKYDFLSCLETNVGISRDKLYPNDFASINLQ